MSLLCDAFNISSIILLLDYYPKGDVERYIVT